MPITQGVRRPPGRPRGGGVVADRQQLLDAAERLIRAQGPDVTMEAIAAEAHVTKPILYRGIGDKDALVTALAERFVERTNDEVAEAIVAATDPRDGLRRFVDAFLDVSERNRNLYLFVTAGGSGDDRVAHVLRLADRSARPIAERVAAQRTVDGLDPAVAMTWSYGLIGMLHFVTLWWIRDQSVERVHLAEQTTELLWSGLRGDPGPSEPSATEPSVEKGGHP